MEVTGRVKVINPVQQISATFKKRELVVTTEEQYPQHIMIEFTQDKTDLLNKQKMLKKEYLNPNEGFTQTAKNFLTDYFGANGFNNASIFGVPNRSVTNRQIQSYLGRARVTLLDKLVLSASLRYDGSSVFGTENKWGLFPSYSAALKLNDDNSETVNNLKFRYSYGEVGNQGIGAYQTTSNTTQSEYIFGPGSTYSVGLLPGNVMPNPFLKWENSASHNVGLDFGFFNNVISGSLEFYTTSTTDLLVFKTLQASSGFSSQLSNLGEVQNRGVELQLSATPIKTKDFTMGVNLTFSQNRNKIISIDGRLDANGNPLSQPNNNWFIGRPVDCYYEYRFDGIFNDIEEVRASAQGRDVSGNPLPDAQLLAKVGSIRVKDVNGDGIINEAGDRDIIDATPDWIGSISTNFNYKGFNLLIINTVIPVKFAYAQNQGKESAEILIDLLATIPAEKNNIIEKFSTFGIKSKNAFQTQALLQLKNNYCNSKKCLNCAIGLDLLKIKND